MVLRASMVMLGLAAMAGSFSGPVLAKDNIPITLQLQKTTTVVTQVPPPAANATPVLVIPFDKEYVNIGDKVRHTVKAAETQKAGTHYQVVTYVAPGTSREQNERLLDKGNRNAQEVSKALIDQGIDPGRISVSTQSLEAGKTPEVRIYTY